MAYIDRAVTSYVDKKMSGAINPALINIESKALEQEFPIISRDVAVFLEQQLSLIKPQKILEIGTAVGYSGSLMLLASEAELTSIEISEDNYQIATQNFADLKLSHRCRLELGDAKQVLDALIAEGESYDFIFIDAAKGHYLEYFKKAETLLNCKGVIIADNVLFKGYPCGLPYVRRQKTIVKRMNNFIEYICQHQDFSTSLLTIGDGLSVSIRKS